MVQVVTDQEFKPVLERLDRLERENEFLRSLLADLRWLNVAQVARALNCSDSTVYRLIKANRIEHRFEGTRPLCSLTGVRNYLAAQKIIPEEADRRVIAACQTS